MTEHDSGELHVPGTPIKVRVAAIFAAMDDD
jgi:hypothetical protein